MSEQTNVEVVQRAYEAFGRGDIPAMLEVMTDDVDWNLQGPSAIPWAGPRHGREEVGEFFSLLGQTLDFEQFEIREIVSQGDTVVHLGYERLRVKQTGRLVEAEWTHVYTLRNGKVAKGRFYVDTAQMVVALQPE